MKKIENDCVHCDIPCVDCGRKHNPHWYCDWCGEEKKLYVFDGEELCAECILGSLEVVKGSEINDD